MLDHLSIGVKNVPASRAFYDAALAPLGSTCLAHGETYLGYGQKTPVLWVNAAARPVPADPESGLHFCFTADTRAAVDAFYRAALATGGRDNGKPGLRPAYGPTYYAAFVVDPDGYRIEAHCNAPA